ncbi:hypothetical protein [Sphaerothrix gracilis]|uniref:hypothetical protein n=1 Tax=Sphaerothrix gracilis TaxID=3151835 RepID=UPI0031FE2E75
MALNAAVMKAVEQLDYRVTVGDVATQAGLNVQVAQSDLLALASETQAHLQVSEAGEIAYEFPRNFRGILQSKYWRLRLQQTWEKVWSVLFYLIRISFGILLLASIALIFITIAILLIAMNSSRSDNDNGGGFGGSRGGGGGFIFVPRLWFGPDLFWFFHYDRGYRRQQPARARTRTHSELNFFEAIFSFLFGDGDPNADLEERRWQTIGTVIRNSGGVVVAEQIAPYLDDLGEGWSKEYEDYMLPVLSRFNGQPEVTPGGSLVYRFPELQVTASDRRGASVAAYLKEFPRQFSVASSGQIMLAIGLGAANIIGALVLGNLLQDQALVAELGGLVAFVDAIYWLLVAYGTAFLSIPLVRYFWVQWRNGKIESRNESRQQRAIAFNRAGSEVQQKLSYAEQFASRTVVNKDDLAYTTEQDLIEQEAEQREKLDAQWQKRLEDRSRPD